MKLSEVMAPKGGWPKKLKNFDEIFAIIQKISPIDEDEKQLEEFYSGCTAVLKEVDVSFLKLQDSWQTTGADKEYVKTPASEFPPLIVSKDGTIQDGGHRFEAAKKRGDKKLLAYVLSN